MRRGASKAGNRAVLRLIGRFALRRPGRLLLSIVLSSVAILAAAGLLVVSGALITGAALAGAGLIATINTFSPSAAVRFFTLVRTVARYSERLVTHEATLRFLSSMRVDVFRGVLQANGRAGTLLGRLSADLEALDGIVIRLAVPLVGAVLLLGGSALMLAAVDPVLAAAVVLPAVLGGVVAPLLLARPADRAMRLKLAALDGGRLRFVDLDRGRAALRTGGLLDLQAGRIGDAFERAGLAETDLARLDARMRFAATAGSQLSLAGAIGVGGLMVQDAALHLVSWVSIVVFTFALGEAIAPMRGIAFDLGRWRVAARRVLPLMHGEAAVASPPAGPVEPASLHLDGVTLRGGGAVRLSAIDLSVGPGERVGLVGASGAGKSTLLAVLAGAFEPDAGRLVRDGGRRIAWLGQRTELFRGSVADNLRLADPAASDERLAALIAAVGLEAALGKAGLARELGDGGSGLSGGERRRLALARLMLQPADLVLVDEATEGLDPETADRVLDALLGWVGSRTLVIATHRRIEAERMGRLVRLADGRIVAAARPGDADHAAMLAALD